MDSYLCKPRCQADMDFVARIRDRQAAAGPSSCEICYGRKGGCASDGEDLQMTDG